MLYEVITVGAGCGLSDRGAAVQRDDRRTSAQEGIDAGAADSGGRARYEHDFAGERGRGSGPVQLGLLEIPVLDLEQVALAHSAPAAQRLGAQNDVNRMVVEVLDNGGVLCGSYNFV